MRIPGVLRLSFVALPLVAGGDNQKGPAASPHAAVAPGAAHSVFVDDPAWFRATAGSFLRGR